MGVALRRWWLPAAVLPLLLAVVVPTSGGCAAKAVTLTDDMACTPGNYVFCRCTDQTEGSKLCNQDGQSFAACLPCPNDPPPVTIPDDAGLPADAGFTPVPVDAQPPPDADSSAAPVIDAQCSGKLAVLASDASSDFVLAGVYTGSTFSVSSSSGVPMLTPASIVPINGLLVASYRSRLDWVVSTTFTNAWSAPVHVGTATSQLAPVVTSWAGKLKMVYLGSDGRYAAANFDPAVSAWDDASEPLSAADAGASPGISAPGAAGAGVPGGLGASIVVGFSGSDGSLYRQSFYGTTWTSTIKSSAAVGSSFGPTLIALDGGNFDLLSVYIGGDMLMHGVTRGAQGTTVAWGIPGSVDTSAQPMDAPSVAPMSNGRAMLVYRDATSKPFFSVFDGAKAPQWTAPMELVAGHNPTVNSTPSVVEGKCGEDASVAYAEKGGGVSIMRYTAGAWTGPYPVAGMTNMTFASIGELP